MFMFLFIIYYFCCFAVKRYVRKGIPNEHRGKVSVYKSHIESMG